MGAIATHCFSEWSLLSAVFLLIFIADFATRVYKQKQRDCGFITSTFEGIPVRIVSSSHALKQSVKELLSQNPTVLGIDCEWRPNTKKNAIPNKIALLQIAHSEFILIVRLNRIDHVQKSLLDSGLLSIFSDPQIVKCGVNIYGDKKKLFRDHNVILHGCVELNHLYSRYSKTSSSDTVRSFIGLKAMSKEILGVEMKYKLEDKSVTLSDWGTDQQLSTEQIHYAAEDALNSYRIFESLIDSEKETKSVLELCFGIIDCNESKTRHRIKSQNKNCRKSKSSKSVKSPKNENFADHQSVQSGVSEHNALYDNCRILRPDGSFLSWCRRKTLDRYIAKRFADRVDENTIKLLFDPRKFTRKPKNEVVLGFKKNECAVCGESKGKLQRFLVVPNLYRKHLPDALNEEAWRRHDVLPMCTHCHFKGQTENHWFKTELCTKYNVPHWRALDRDLINDTKLMRDIKPLMDDKVRPKIPDKKKKKLLERIASGLEMEYTMIDDDVKCIEDTNTGKESEGYWFNHLIRVHGQDGNGHFMQRMKAFEEEFKQKRVNLGKMASRAHALGLLRVFKDKEFDFIKLWRQHFVDRMNPRYLPQYWSIDSTFYGCVYDR